MFDPGSFTTSTAVTPTQPPQQGGSSELDPELSQILNEVIDIVPEPYHQISDLLGFTSANVGAGVGGIDHSSMSVDSVEAAVAVVSAASSAAVAASLSSSASASSAITTNAMGGSVSVASSSNMVHGGRPGQMQQQQQQQTGNMLSGGPNGPSGNAVSASSVNVGGQSGGLHSGMQMGNSGHITEQAAISEIEKSLRQYEKGGNYSGSPPAYPMHAAPNKFLTRAGIVGGNGPLFTNNGMSVALNNNNNNMSIPNNNQGGFPMPPNYSQRPAGVVQQRMAMGGGGQVPRLQNMQRERLLMEQAKQQLVVPQNATNSGLNPGMGDIGSLINNTVAPNVSLQRSNSAVRDAQLSPGFNSNAFQQMSPGQNRAGPPFSPVQGAGGQQQQNPGQQGPPPNYQAAFPGSAEIQPMSPQFGSPEMMTLLNMNKPNTGGGGVVLAQQLSPRQPPFSSPQPQNQWTHQQQQNAQMSLQQQQNPMLKAQLTVSGNRRGLGVK